MKKCRACKKQFEPWNSLAIACSIPCAREVARVKREKQERKEQRELRQKLKTRSEHMQEAQKAFNAYIRERDASLPCISCGKTNPPWTRGGQWDCGHYRSTGACPELRFEPLNAAKQCKQCNSHLSGNAVDMRVGMVRKLGTKTVEWLEGSHEPRKYTIEELQQIKAEYRHKTRELKRRREAA